MPGPPTLVFVPGAWHKPSCYDKVIKLLQHEYNLKCIAITLPSTQGDPTIGMKEDIDAARNVVVAETSRGNNVVVISHSYGGMIGNSCIKGLTRPNPSGSIRSGSAESELDSRPPPSGYVLGLVLIASGFTLEGLAVMDPFFGIPPPQMQVNKESGYIELRVDPRDFFYHDLVKDEADYWVSQLTTQTWKSQSEDGEHSYPGWQDVPVWYIGTLEDRGLPVVVQRMQIGMARGQGCVVHHTELKSSHSPFLSMPREVASIIIDCVETVNGEMERVADDGKGATISNTKVVVPVVRLGAPLTWIRFGMPFLFGRILGWGYFGFRRLRKYWRG